MILLIEVVLILFFLPSSSCGGVGLFLKFSPPKLHIVTYNEEQTPFYPQTGANLTATTRPHSLSGSGIAEFGMGEPLRLQYAPCMSRWGCVCSGVPQQTRLRICTLRQGVHVEDFGPASQSLKVAKPFCRQVAYMAVVMSSDWDEKSA
jgi:hypothetical protein